MIAFLILMQISILFPGTIGIPAYSCPDSTFACGNGGCIYKHQWCDDSEDCDNLYDEKFCGHFPMWDYRYTNCDEGSYFRCNSSNMCIPIEGYCDGYSSCPDRSDEANCPCHQALREEENMRLLTRIGSYRTQQKCWILSIKDERYLNLSIQARLFNRPCLHGNITLFYAAYGHGGIWSTIDYDSLEEKQEEIKEKEYVICPAEMIRKDFTFTVRGDVTIRYRSDWYTSETQPVDFLNITYSTVDPKCSNPGAFKCSTNSCILPGKLCDGKKDCKNGIDEQNCDFASFAATDLQKNLENVTKWLRNQHTTNWGWKENTPRAVVALYLGNALTFSQFPKEDDLIAKQLELEVSTYLLRSKVSNISLTELSVYINALLAICHNPRNFFGFDLILKLKEEIGKVPGYVAPLPYLTLCNAKEEISDETVDRLLETLEKSSDHGFILEVQALAIMALSCISNDDRYVHLKQNITEALNNLKQEQREDGSFGNEYTTALVLQALIANNQVNDKDWNLKSSIEFLQQKQKADGSFGDFLTASLVMPVLNAKSLADVGKVNCTENLIRPKEGNLVSDIKNRLGGKIPVKYSVFIGDDKDQIHPIFLRAPENITALELMALAADIDPKYIFKTQEIKKKIYVYEILNIPNDPEDNKFWFLYHDVGNGTVPVSTQDPNEMRVGENDHIILWYKTLG